jgi:hypothetical protein
LTAREPADEDGAMNDDDRERLIAFVGLTERSIMLAIENVPEPEMRELAFAALRDIDERDEFNRLRQAIAGREYDDRLDAAGLSGPQLAFKLAVVGQREGDVNDALGSPDAEEPPEAADPARPPRPRGRIRRAIAKLLDAIDVILDSLAGALHGVGDVIKELKQALENWLGD